MNNVDNKKEVYGTLKEAALASLIPEYAEYYYGLKGVLERLGCYAPSVKYLDVQRSVLNVIANNRQMAESLNEYFDSDYMLANAIIDDIHEELSQA